MADSTNPNANNSNSANFLPRFYRTDSNKKFLQATVDQLIQPGEVKNVNGFIGRQNSKATVNSDIFITATSDTRQNYQLEPSLTVKDTLGNTTFFKDYQDYVNQLGVFGANTKNHARLNEQEFYSWDPHIDWDKFVNFQNYYWLPYGPDTIAVYGEQEKIESTYTVKIEPEGDSNTYIFTPTGLTRNPTIKLYRGQTYTFEIDSIGNPFSIKTSRTSGTLNRYYDVGLSGSAVESGTITFTVPFSAPDVLYYQSETDIDLGGVMQVLSVDQNTVIDIDSEILGKVNYTTADGTVLSNGMKVRFIGTVTPAEYATGQYYVEGVGTGIKLVNETLLELISPYTTSASVLFDSTPFDKQPFSDATSYAGSLDYIVINRSSKDHNPWSRYNRWFHKDTIEASAIHNGKIPSLDQTARAVRPIIEFEADLKLFNFGTTAIADVDLVDTYTTDVFSTIEGTLGYSVDGISLAQGQRVLFTADTDNLVANKIFQVTFIEVENTERTAKVRQIHLVETVVPKLNDVILVKQGIKYQGTMRFFDGANWKVAQQKSTLNQPPTFDIVNAAGVSFSDTSVYDGSTFTGTKLFSYKVGSGATDANLGFALSYKNINNIGDIVFNFNLAADTFEYRNVSDIVTTNINVGYLVKTNNVGTLTYVNGWQTCTADPAQAAIRIYKNSNVTNNFTIDLFDDVRDLQDLKVRVYVNGKRLAKDQWTIVTTPAYKKIVLNSDITTNDVLSIRAFAAQPINANGYYEIPVNLQNNPLNDAIGNFTLGEVIDHVDSIVDNLYVEDADPLTPTFVGAFPGASNLRDLGNITQYGTKFVQHSGPISLSGYHITSESNNIVRSIEEARDDYNKFKRNFIKAADQIGVDADPTTLVDLILTKMGSDKPKTAPYYFSDMAPYGAHLKNDFPVVDYRIKTYPLTNVFSLDDLSAKSVLIYVTHNAVTTQLIFGRDYSFNSQGFVVIHATIENDDVISIYEFDSTDGCFIPETPTKLGIWPKYTPLIYVDTSLLTPRTMIQGHDGSQTLAFGDYRDELILELEKRIYNNIKIEYNPDIFDITDIIPSYGRTTTYSLAEFNEVLAPNFYKWTSLVDRDFTKSISYDRNDPFTFNYRGHAAPDGRETPGYWRGVYRWILDTDRPNICPWEMLGFSEEPTWWTGLYGPAPYTSDNLVMWQDITDGAIRQPNTPVVFLHKFAKPFLMGHIPVDNAGNLISPLTSGLSSGIITTNTSGDFIFGDISPVEAAWRRSSHYSFSVIISAMLLKPAKTFGLLLDRSRIVRNAAGQLIYKDTGIRVQPAAVKLPSIYSSSTRVQTAGIINYIVDYILSDNLKSYNAYQYDLQHINAQLSHRLGGFTSKEKFNLILDSKTPLSSGSVFVPQEDYDIILNTSSPIKKITYSGVIVTKLQDGYEVKGYSKTQPYFKYYAWVQAGTTINVGGISKSYISWTANQRYSVGKIVQFGNLFYTVTTLHTTTSTFNPDFYQVLSSLPIVGGRNANLRKLWNRDDSITVPYGTQFRTVQEVVDFLLGYGEYLKDQGFIFDDFNNAMATVTNWETSAKEFLFWTTQNWSTGEDKWAEWLPNVITKFDNIVRYDGDYYRALRNSPASAIFISEDFDKLDGLSNVGSSVISLSPAAAKLTFAAKYSVVDDIKNPFNGYEIFQVDGTPIAPDFLNSYRDDAGVSYSPSSSAGIYGATFYLVQKEQVVILNSTTMFNDTIYNPASGYKQERIKVSGYLSTNWTGAFSAPGFIFDQANIEYWEAWKDYALGDITKYKEYYYSASTFLPGAETFNASVWIKLDSKPTAKLLPNWTYKASQFEDFYSLDSSNFDVGQQKIAQHLIGYQKRQYLENIIQNDVSEFKFYQGMIIEKGTQNVLNKLFDVLSADGVESLKFHEEWALRVGQYGANGAYENIEFILDEAEFKNNPQGFELVNTIKASSMSDFISRQTPNDVYLKPLGYNSAPFPVLANYTSYLRSAGFARADEVALTISTVDQLLSEDITMFSEGDYVWCTFAPPPNNWNVYILSRPNYGFVSTTFDPSAKTLTLVTDTTHDFTTGDIIGLTNIIGAVGFYKVTDTTSDSIVVDLSASKLVYPDPDTNVPAEFVIFKLVSQLADTIDNLEDFIPTVPSAGAKLWTLDSGNGKWASWIYNPVYSASDLLASAPTADLQYGRAVVISETGKISATSTKLGEVIIYDKAGLQTPWLQRQTITQPFIAVNDANDASVFGTVLAMSADAKWLATGSPLVDNAATATANGLNIVDADGTESGLTAQGVISLYEKDANNIYSLFHTIVSPTPADNENFGSSLSFGNNILYIGAPGANADTGAVYKLKFSTSVEASSSYNPNGSEGTTLVVTSTSGITIGMAVVGTGFTKGQIVAQVVNATTLRLSAAPTSTPDGIINFTLTYWRYDLSATYSGTTTGSKFGSAVAISSDNSTLVVGAPDGSNGTVFVYEDDTLFDTLTGSGNFGHSVTVSSTGQYIAISSSTVNTGAGSVNVYVKGTTSYTSAQDEIANRFAGDNEHFGDKVFFMNDYQSLVIFSNNTAGRIDIYDRYASAWRFSESLASTGPTEGFGQSIAVGTNCIIVGAPSATISAVTSGKIYQYSKPNGTLSWSIAFNEIDKPDVRKIKQAFLYNKSSNTLIKYIDIIDPNQGKIPGIADEEIKYKTFYDPAMYSLGDSTVNVDDGQAWTTRQVGMLWWDLRNCKFTNSYDSDIVYRNSTWNTLAVGASVDIYEWVESKYKPSEWDAIADTDAGITANISGTSLYGNTAYSIVKRFDTTSKTYKSLYYYWVKNKKTIPNVAGRKLTAQNVTNLIANPRGEGYSYLALTGANSFSLVNVQNLLVDKEVVLSVEYWTVDKIDQNIHTQWKLLSDDVNTVLPVAIEEKLIDSLCGKDLAGRLVPDTSLPPKLRYGIENRPRQSMFVNRFEALKQFVEQANLFLATVQIAEKRNISNLEAYDTEPSLLTGTYDIVLDTDAELRFANVGAFKRPSITPIIVDGKITGVDILEKGSGYINAPYVNVVGTGIDAKIQLVINAKGQVTGAKIISAGQGYTDSTVLIVRDYSVLVHSDSKSGSWSIYSYDLTAKVWSMILSQTYDVRNYWNYADWFATGYNQFTAIDYAVDTFAEVVSSNAVIGNIVKVRTTNLGSWALLEKYAESTSVDWTQSYKMVGQQNGTIQLSSSLYQFNNTTVGYDGLLYDGGIFDNVATTELRIILNTLKDDIFVDDLKSQYLNLFFTCVRYALSEQTYLDWIFKTSFVKSQHNVGDLHQPVNYRNDNLSNFEDYVSEVKPYRTKVREYVSAYTKTDVSALSMTDFDIPPVYENDGISIIGTNIVDGKIEVDNPAILTYPWKHWLDNVGFKVSEIKIVDNGQHYQTEPVVRFISKSGSGATARAFIANGKVNRISLLTSGSGYLSAPTIIIDGGLSVGGTAATAVAIIGDSVIRSSLIKMKFDRVTQTYFITQLEETETFIGTGSRKQFALKWAPDNRIGQSTVVVNGVSALRSNYNLATTKSTSRGYTSYAGAITFNTAPAKGDPITVTYLKDWALLNAADRIQYYYNPEVGELGKDLSQLMTGIDYGGVTINGLGFEVGSGWESLPYASDKWDTFDATFDDYIVTVGADTHSFTLPYTPLAGTEINIYYIQRDTEDFVSDGSTLVYAFNYNIDTVENVFVIRTVPAGGVVGFYNAVASSGTTLVLTSTAGITAGMKVIGNNFLSGQTVISVDPDGVTLTLSVAPNTVPNDLAQITFTDNVSGASILHVSDTSGIAVGDVVTTSSVPGTFGYGVTVVSIIDSTTVQLDQILFDTLPAQADILFTRTLVTPTDVTVFGNGTFTLTNPVPAGSVIRLTGVLLAVRIDDMHYGTPANTNESAVMQTPIADGASSVFTIPPGFPVFEADKFILRKSTSDGSIKPQEADYDTALTGGNLAYSTATGIAADDILIDGDGFVTPTSSSAPEEVVPGQVIDTLAIKVYDRPMSGSANIKVDSYVADGTQTDFKINQAANSPQAIIVKTTTSERDINGDLLSVAEILTVDDDYIVDYRNSLVKFNVAPAVGKLVSLFSFGFNGSNILDLDYFVGDGTTLEFITKAPWLEDITYLIYIDGVPASYEELFKTDATYDAANRIGIRFGVAPENLSLINFVIVSGNTQTFAVTKTERIQTNGALTYPLEYAIGDALPIESNIIVRVDQTILKGPNNSYFKIGSNRLNYQLDPAKFLPYGVDITDIVVLADGNLLAVGTDYIIDLSGITIKLNRLTYREYAGKSLIISVKAGQGYNYVPPVGDQPAKITFAEAYDNTHIVEVISSYKHDILDIQRTAVNVSSSLQLTPDTVEYYNYSSVVGGKIKLDRAVIDDNYVWVIRNGTLLTPSVDFIVLPDRQNIKLTFSPAIGDEFALITYGSNILTSGIAYLQFKDMLNRVHFKRLSVNKQTQLVNDLHYNDTTILVVDASTFDLPNPARNRPGVVEIRGERIEFFTINGNTLGQLRRGTLGTGTPKVHLAGSYVQEIGASETIPYADGSVIAQVISDGTNILPLDFVPMADIIANGHSHTTVADWTYASGFVSTIPTSYIQPDDIEVFVGGYDTTVVWAPAVDYSVGVIVTVGSYTYRCVTAHTSGTVFNLDTANWQFFIGNIRLKKKPYKVHNVNQAPDSPEGDLQIDADFAVDGVSAQLRLTNKLAFGTQVTVIKRNGTAWDDTVNIQFGDSKIAKFLKAQPGVWYTDMNKSN